MFAGVRQNQTASSQVCSYSGVSSLMRNVIELQAKARELRRMALTATATETQTALLTLAGRYEAFARQIADDPTRDDPGPDQRQF